MLLYTTRILCVLTSLNLHRKCIKICNIFIYIIFTVIFHSMYEPMYEPKRSINFCKYVICILFTKETSKQYNYKNELIMELLNTLQNTNYKCQRIKFILNFWELS